MQTVDRICTVCLGKTKDTKNKRRRRANAPKSGMNRRAGIWGIVGTIAMMAVIFSACKANGTETQMSAPAATAIAATATPKPTPLPAATPVPTPFSIAWFPDTQTSAYRQREALTAMGTWVREHRVEDNIVQVVQTGDLVEYAGHPKEWDAFYSAYDQFAGDIPYIAVPGNHDMLGWPKTFDIYLTQRFLDELPAQQKYLDGVAAYTLLSAGGTDFIIIGCGYQTVEDCADWINEQLRAYSDRVAILIFHDYLHQAYGLYDSGPYAYEHIVTPNKNVKLVLCGHFRGSCYRQDSFDDDGDGTAERTVHQMMFNCQNHAKGGQMRLLTFDPATRSLTVNSFSTYFERRYEDWTLGKDPFTLEDAF